MNTMKRLTRTTLTTPLPSSSIHLCVQISLFPTDWLLPSPPLPCVTPLLSVPSFSPQQPQPGELPHSAWPSTPLLAVSPLAFSQICVDGLVIV